MTTASRILQPTAASRPHCCIWQAFNEAFINFDFAAFLLNFGADNFSPHCAHLHRPGKAHAYGCEEKPSPAAEVRSFQRLPGCRCAVGGPQGRGGGLACPWGSLPAFFFLVFMVVKIKSKHLAIHMCDLQTSHMGVHSLFLD